LLQILAQIGRKCACHCERNTISAAKTGSHSRATRLSTVASASWGLIFRRPIGRQPDHG